MAAHPYDVVGAFPVVSAALRVVETLLEQRMPDDDIAEVLASISNLREVLKAMHENGAA